MRARAINYILTVGLVFVAACGGRTSAATQPTPAAFDPTQSDAKAVQLADALIAKIGGAEAWAAVKQIRWEHKVFHDNDLKSWVKHSWDIWNGRHRCETVVMATYLENKADPEAPIKWNVAMYDLFNHEGGKGTALSGGQPVYSGDRKMIINSAYESWRNHAYQLTMLHKLKDPGVKLTYAGQMKNVSAASGKVMCDPACDTLKVSYLPEVGDDAYWVQINTQTGLPDYIEKRPKGGSPIAHAIIGWSDVKGLKFPTEFQNAGVPAEVIKIEDIKIGSPDDELYIPRVR